MKYIAFHWRAPEGKEWTLARYVRHYRWVMAFVVLVMWVVAVSGCAGLSIGSVAGTSTVSVACGTGTAATYSAGLIPQMQPVNATCTGADGKTQQAGISPGIDIATIAALVKQSMLTKGEILAPTQQQPVVRGQYLAPQ